VAAAEVDRCWSHALFFPSSARSRACRGLAGLRESENGFFSGAGRDARPRRVDHPGSGHLATLLKYGQLVDTMGAFCQEDLETIL
jgi:hypothetical protein